MAGQGQRWALGWAALVATAMGATAGVIPADYIAAQPLAPTRLIGVGVELPTEARSAHEEGNTGLLFDVAVDGSVTNCRVVKSSESKSLDQASCPFLARHRHYVAATLRGARVAETNFEIVYWRDRPDVPPEPLREAPEKVNVDGPASTLEDLKPLITTADDPPTSFEARETGAVGVMFDISETGEPELCRVMQSSGHDRLDAQTCAIVLQRLRYRPAISNGRTVRDVSALRFRWAIPHKYLRSR